MKPVGFFPRLEKSLCQVGHSIGLIHAVFMDLILMQIFEFHYDLVKQY